ncbi:MAG: DUF3313 domain-containing protein [Deltaproteobacteria bacterium]|nr:DUF3313 domain-containing protein [Deltaproteobacteria bacterium]
MRTDIVRRIMSSVVAGSLMGIVLLSGCSTTVESTPAAAKALESGGPLPPAVTGFFGADASKLAPGPEGGAALAYVNTNAQWSKYTKIQLTPVEFWAAADSKVSTADQQILTTYFYNKLKADLGQSFALVDQPGPDVLTLRVALMDATTAIPGLRSISVVVPQARIINAAQSLATGSYAFVGSAEGEMKATDSTTGEMLAGAVDQRAGGMGIKGAASFQWGDAENTMDYWAEKITSRLLQLQGKSPAQT